MAQEVTLLLTRPRGASERFAAEMPFSLPTIISPLIKIQFYKIDAPAADHIIFTSRNGVEAWVRSGLPVSTGCFCVGEATAEAARESGFDAQASGGTVEHLLEDLNRIAPDGKIIHVRGAHARGDLVQRLKNSGLSAEAVIAYDQKLLDLSEDARRLVQGGAPVIVPLFSPRTAKQFAEQGLACDTLDIIAISPAAAAECPAARVATFPSAAGMIEAIAASRLLVQ